MKLQFKILLFILCLNLATGLVIALGLPGTEYVQAQNPTANPEEYEKNFNSTEIGQSWGATPFYGIPVIGDIFAGFQFLFTHIHFLIDGFPQFLNWISDTYIVDVQARGAFALIANTVRAIYAVLMSIWFIEYIGGRYLTD